MMNRMYPSDFNVSESNSNGCFIRMDELNDMIAYGVLKLDETKLKEYHFDTRVTYNKEIYTREQAMNLFGNLVRR
nr:MAG TPA: hypothetical protein [Caudoviricetes sp.]